MDAFFNKSNRSKQFRRNNNYDNNRVLPSIFFLFKLTLKIKIINFSGKRILNKIHNNF